NRIARTAEKLRRGTRLPLKVLLPTTAALGAGGALAAAAIPGSNGVITACYSTLPVVMGEGYVDDAAQYEIPVYGNVRVIDPSATPETTTTDWNQESISPVPVYNSSCAPWEQTVTWNQQGPAGPQGPAGKDGTNGQNGSIEGAATFEIDASGSTELFAKLADISGTAKVEGQSGLISLQSLAFGAESPVVVGTGQGSKQTVQTFEFTKKVDKTSTQLFTDLQDGKAITKMQVEADHATKKGATEDATYTFTDVKLKSITQKGGKETVIGVFTKMQSSIGSGSSKVQTSLNPGGGASWDLTQSKAS
ncbi:MAG TPA: type VI secretion system tube protein Hcp, partial [Solirubrobacteraceae bacterium]|nr:type VI secretion system tube protein Hcp [Solirubrobacteraceae bacterium]